MKRISTVGPKSGGQDRLRQTRLILRSPDGDKKATPKSSKYDKIHSDPQTLRLFSIMGGGQSGSLTFFLNELLTGQHLANSGGGGS